MTIMTPRVSVVMPVFNGERYIAEAVRSVLASRYDDLELLVIDDGSTDASVREALDAAAGDPRVRIVTIVHGGVGAARNAGVHAACGELIANLDADDAMLPERLSRQVAYMDRHPECVALGCRAVVVDADGRPVEIGVRVFSHEEIEATNLDGRLAIWNPTVMFRRKTALAVGGYASHLATTGEDYDLWLRMGEVGRLVNLPDVLVRYRLHDNNISLAGADRERRKEIRLQTLARAYDRRRITTRQPALGYRAVVPRWERRCNHALVRYFSGDRVGAIAHAVAAWARQPTSPATRSALRTILRAGPPGGPNAPAWTTSLNDSSGIAGGFLTTFLGALCVFLAGVLLLFGTINPLGGFWGDRFPTTTPITRARKEKLFDAWNRARPVEGLILGSSRSMKLDPREFSARTGKRFFNFAVSTGGLADVSAILDYVDEHHAQLHEIVLGVDPMMLAPYQDAQELQADWELAPRAEGRRPTLLWKIGHGVKLFKESLSLSYLHELVVSIRARRQGREPLHTFLSDGYLEYRGRDRAIAAGRYNRNAAISSCIGEYSDSLVSKHTFDRGRVALLRRTLDSARAHGITVTLWLAPWHPAFYRAISGHPDILAYFRAVQDTVARIAAERGVRFVSLPRLQDFSGDSTDWYDCVHYGNGNASRITDRITAARDTGSARVVQVLEGAR